MRNWRWNKGLSSWDVGTSKLSLGLVFGLLSGCFNRLLMSFSAQGLDRSPKLSVGNVRVDFCRREVLVTEGALNEPDVAGLFVEPGREAVAKRVGSAVASDIGFFKPVLESKLYLAGTDSLSTDGCKEGTIQVLGPAS